MVVDSNWGSGVIAYGRSDYIKFSSSRSIYVSGGDYRITVGSDDGIRLWIDGVLKLDKWLDRPYTTDAIDVSLSAGNHNFKLDYYENEAEARVSFAIAQQQHTLTVTKAGTGSGTVTSNPPGINCGADCTENYDYGTSVTLTAAPNADSNFTGWSGDADCSDGIVSMTASKTCTATFALNEYLLTVSKAGTGSGRVTSSPPGIDCGTNCTNSYYYGTVVTLTATPDAGSAFTGWSGACSGTGVCTVTMDADKSVTASFAVIVTTPDVSGDINLGGSPIANRKVLLKQKGQLNQTTTTDSGGYYEFAHVVSGIKYTVQISGPTATSTNISGCADFRGAPIVNKPVKLKQSLELTKSTKTDASGCYSFTNAVLGKTFKVIITGPVVP